MSDDSLLDSKIGGFLLLQKIGQGGMGSVYMARQLSLERVVAIKILAPQLAKDKATRERFLKEAKASAKLHHPNIVSIHSAGYDSGHSYYSMEYIEGGSVKELIATQGKIPESQALEIIYDICQALHHAHQKNIVHRDIKPDNFMITKEGVVKLGDLGIAKILEDDAHLTQEGLFMGTPYFTSPEQAKGQKDIDIRSDLYSVGASLFNMLTGRYPFESSSPLGVIAMHINDPAPLVSVYEPTVTKATVQLIDRLLKKEREQRFQTPMELMNAIVAILKKHHNKNRSLRVSQQMPAVEVEIDTPRRSIVMPTVIGVIVLIFAYIGFSLFKKQPNPLEPAPNTEVALESGLAKRFKIDKEEFLLFMQKPNVTVAQKRSRFKELVDIYKQALSNEVSLLELELLANIDVSVKKSLDDNFDKKVAEADRYYKEKRMVVGLKLLLSISDSKEIEDLSQENKGKYLEKCQEVQQNFINRLTDEFIPIKDNADANLLTQIRNILASTKKFENSLLLFNNALNSFAKNGVTPVEKSEIANTNNINNNSTSVLAPELINFTKNCKANLLEKKFVNIVREYRDNKNRINAKQNEAILNAEAPEVVLVAKSLDKVYTDFANNFRKLGEGEAIEITGQKYVVTGVTLDSVLLMNDKKELQEILFDKLPDQMIQTYTYNIRDFDPELRFSFGVYSLISGNKTKSVEILKNTDDKIINQNKIGLENLSKQY